jgi:hypothetical protein
MNGAEEHLLVVGGAAIWPQTGARANEAHDDSEDNDSSSDLGAKQENLIKRWTSSLRVIVVQSICLKTGTSSFVSCSCCIIELWVVHGFTYPQVLVNILCAQGKE